MPKGNPVRNQLAEVRKHRGIGAAELARRIGVSRQTIYAIEAGNYVPNTGISLRLARELEVPVEQLFSLPERSERKEARRIEMLGEGAASAGPAVRVCRVGEKLVGIPARAAEAFLAHADGVFQGAVTRRRNRNLLLASSESELEGRVLVAGCDPAIGLLAHMVEKLSGAELVAAPASSSLALEWLKQGKVHIAGTHLEDPATGEFNLPFTYRRFPQRDVMVVTFARWDEGLLVSRGNPKNIRAVDDLARKGVCFVNREKGSGSRALLDRLLQAAGVPTQRVAGYGHVAGGHLAAANAVAIGKADCCIATRSAALAYGLDFIPLREERFDFVVRREYADLPPVKAILDVLQRADLRRKLALIAGCDTARTGVAVA